WKASQARWRRVENICVALLDQPSRRPACEASTPHSSGSSAVMPAASRPQITPCSSAGLRRGASAASREARGAKRSESLVVITSLRMVNGPYGAQEEESRPSVAISGASPTNIRVFRQRYCNHLSLLEVYWQTTLTDLRWVNSIGQWGLGQP